MRVLESIQRPAAIDGQDAARREGQIAHRRDYRGTHLFRLREPP
jgi:hypothetical protein